VLVDPESSRTRRARALRRAPWTRLAPLAVAAAIACASAPAAAQSDQDKAAARSLATQGGQALAASKYSEALDLVTRAESLLHAPTHLLMIARADIGLGRYVAAQEVLLKLTREELAPTAPPAFKNAQEQGKAELVGVEAKIANVRIAVTNAKGRKVTFKIDETPVPDVLVGVYVPTDPGKHVVTATAQGGVGRATVEVAPGDKKDVSITLLEEAAAGGAPATPPVVEEPAPKQGFFTTTRIIGIGVAAVGVGGVVLGTIELLQRGSTKSTADKFFNECNPTGCSPTQETTVKSNDTTVATEGTISVIGFAAGGAALIAGGTLIFLGGPKKPATTGVTPYFTGTGAGLRGSF
jgi:hypothetical protein